MIALMTSTLMAATVGLAISMSVAGSKTMERTTEEPVAASFVKFKSAFECWARVNPSYTGWWPPNAATLKSTVDANGVPCLHSAYGSLANVGSYASATTVYTLMYPTTVYGVTSPTWEIQRYYGRSSRGGIVNGAGQVVNLNGVVYPNDLGLPPGSIVYMKDR